MSYAITGWIITLGVVAAYGAALVLRERRLTTQVPAERRRWMNAPDE